MSMNGKQLVERIKKIILENAGECIVSLYAIGSFPRKEMVESSDIDLVGIMKASFDFRKERLVNKTLNKKIRSKHRIDLGTMSYDEFFGGKQQGSLTRHVDLPVFMNFLKNAKLIYGRKLDFNTFPIKPASKEDELKYHIRIFDKYKDAFRKKDRIAADFSFKDLFKIIFYIANIEVQISRKTKPKKRYFDIAKAFRNERHHIVHYSLKLRKKKTITNDEKRLWFDMAENYVRKMKKLT